MDLWGFLCVLSAFAATGDCLQCITCTAVSAASCSVSNPVTCSDGQVCASQLTISITSGVISQYFSRFCAPQSECSVAGAFTYYSTLEKIATTCCSNDSCTPEIPQVPTVSSQANGVTCPQCALPGDSCGANQNVNCTGNQTMCLLVSNTQTTTGAQTALTINRGCASSGYCIKNNMNYTNNGIYTQITYTCTNGTSYGYISNSTTSTTTNVTLTTQSANNGTYQHNFSLFAVVSLLLLMLM